MTVEAGPRATSLSGTVGARRAAVRKQKEHRNAGTAYLLLTVLALLFIAPILFMLVGSFKPDDKVLADGGSWAAFWPGGFTLSNYSDVFDRVNFGRFMLNSIVITGLVVALGLVVNSMAAYALSRLRWRGRGLVFLLVLAVVILPFEAIAVPLFYEVTKLGWRDSYHVQILPFVANAFSIYLFYTAFLSIPRQIDESAKIDGASPFRIFWQLIVPMSRPAFASVTILTFLTQWGSFLWPIMVTSGETFRPLPVAIADFQTLPPREWGDIMAFGVMLVAPVLVVFFAFQRWFVASIAATGLRE